jgi:hypothetical protein
MSELLKPALVVASVAGAFLTSAYPKWVACVRQKALGETAQEVVAFLKQNRSFDEGVSTALAKTLSARCAH